MTDEQTYQLFRRAAELAGRQRMTRREWDHWLSVAMGAMA